MNRPLETDGRWKLTIKKKQHIAQSEKETLCIMMQEHFEQLFDI